MNIEIIKRLHNVYDDMILGNIELAHKELGKILNDEQLTLTDVSGMFSAEQMEQAYNDGVEAEQQRCGEFNIENYCFSNDL